MPKTPTLVLTLLLVTSLASNAAAQRVSFRITGGAQPVHGVLDVSTGVVLPSTEAEAQVDGVFSSDGQFAVSSVTGGILVRHMPSGQVIALPADFRAVMPHPRRLMLFGFTGVSGLARLDERGLVNWTPCAGTTTVTTFDVSPDGQQLFVACPAGEIVVVDTETGAEVRRINGVAGTIRMLQVNALATELVVLRDAAVTELARLDAQTGSVIARRDALQVATRTGSRRQLLEYACTMVPITSCQFQLVDTASLAVSRALPASRTLPVRVFVSPDGAQALFNHRNFSFQSRAELLDVATGQTLAETAMGLNEVMTVNYVPVPMAPVAPAVATAAGSVTLSWHLPAESPQASGYRLDLGTLPGATNLGSIALGPAETFSATGVPPGRYYVRVRAVNYTGMGAPSLELVVDVP